MTTQVICRVYVLVYRLKFKNKSSNICYTFYAHYLNLIDTFAVKLWKEALLFFLS